MISMLDPSNIIDYMISKYKLYIMLENPTKTNGKITEGLFQPNRTRWISPFEKYDSQLQSKVDYKNAFREAPCHRLFDSVEKLVTA